MSEPTVLDEAIEQHIRGLQWSADTSDYVKTIVAGNIRHVFSALHVEELWDALRDQMDPITRCVESCPVKRDGSHSMACVVARQIVDKLERMGA